MTTPSEGDGAPHGVLVVDKSRGPTSHDVVNVARRALSTRAVGHTGTLDPMATGVLVLVIGEATKLVNSLGALQKRYEATVRLGASTISLDAESAIDESADIPPFCRADVERAAERFLGDIDQRAPNVSAIKVDGKSLYKRVRSGEIVEAPVRRVRLDAIEVGALRDAELDVALTTGPGFYVRSFARDLALALGTLGHLTALRRTQNGAYDLAEAVTFEQLKAARDDQGVRAAVRARVLPLAAVCRSLPHLTLDAAGVVHARCGRAIPLSHVLSSSDAPQIEVVGSTVVAFDEGGAPLALVERLPEQLRVMRGFRTPLAVGADPLD
jgi:tRNA pseudouridine55 synthase